MEEKISLQEVIQTLKKRMALIITVTLVAVVLSAIYTFFVVTPNYQASTQILVNQAENENDETSTTDIQSSRELINTYNVIITSPAILEPAIENSDFNGSVGELRSKIEVSAQEESQVASINVEDSDPQTAVMLANTLGSTFEQQIPEIMNVDNVSILSEAQLSDSANPISPQPSLNLFAAMIIGLMIGIGLSFLLELLDKTIKNEQDIEDELEIPILGVVPVMKEEEFKNASNNKFNKKNSRSQNRDKERKTS